ncbi:MAG: hypothetical protein J7K37_02915, partial [Candidatus Omnitrophica bacterium]|nr:hypothetical protein [Candidatus Omnitrophota bacterium]
MNHFLFSAFLASISTFILGIFVISRDIKSELYRIYALYCFGIALWTFCVSQHTPDLAGLKGIIYGRLLHFGAILIQVFFLHFIFIFLNIYKKEKRKLFITYLIAFVLIGFNFFSKLLVKGIGYSRDISYTKAGVIYPLFCLYTLWSIGYGIYSLFKGYKIASPSKRNQIKYLLLGSIIGYLGGVDKLLVSYNIHILPFYPFGAYTIPIYVGIIAYAIVKHRLMDIRVAITRAGIFAFVYSLVLGIPFIIGYLTKSWLIPTTIMFFLATTGP